MTTNRSAIAHTDTTSIVPPDIVRRFGGPGSTILEPDNLFTPNLSDTVAMVKTTGNSNFVFDVNNIAGSNDAASENPWQMLALLDVKLTNPGSGGGISSTSGENVRYRIRPAQDQVWSVGSATGAWTSTFNTARNVRENSLAPENRGIDIYVPIPPFIGGPFATPQSMNSVRIELFWFGNQHSPADPVVMEIGKLFIGKVFVPKQPIDSTPSYGTRFTTISSSSRGGALYGTELFRKRNAQVTFPCLTTYEIWGNPYFSFEQNTFGIADNDNNFAAIEQYSGTLGPVILFPEYPTSSLISDVWLAGNGSPYTAAWNSAAIKALYGRISNYGDNLRRYNADELLSLEFLGPIEQRKDSKEDNYSKTITVEEYI